MKKPKFDILSDDRIMIFKKNLLKASNYLWELIKYCDFLLKINGKVNDDGKEDYLHHSQHELRWN